MKKTSIFIWIIIIVISSLMSCSHSGPFQPSKTFVLVHGAWQAPYVWQAVKTQLEANRQRVIVVELPAHGNDSTSPANVTIDVYRDKVIEAMQGIHGNVILVGHSMGGVVVSAVAEKMPGKIEKLVYIGAFVPANGQSLGELASTDQQSHLGPNLIPSKDGLTLDVVHDSITSIFCQDALPAVQKLVLENYRAEPAIPFSNQVTLTDNNFGKVNKYYIYTLQDHAIGMDLQNQMVSTAKISNTYSLNTGHCPFLSQPGEVTKLLLSIAK